MNKDLKNKIYTCPDKIIDELKINIKLFNGDKHGKGYKRTNDIINNPNISHTQMMRMKTDFSKYGDVDSEEFKLIGGSMMKNWVEDILQNAMDSISKVKDGKKDGGLQNTHIKNHEKGISKNPMDVSNDNNKTVYEEEIKQMKYLIEYLDNNNKNKIL